MARRTAVRLWLDRLRGRPHGVIAGAVALNTDHILGGWLFPDKMEVRAHGWKPGPSI